MLSIPDPLVPASCDLNSFPDMPMEINRLRRSAAWRACKRRPELAFYMVNLWLASWHEVPAGSLEDDDDALADLALCDLKKWPKVKQEVMRGWVKCSDGRLYHPVVAEKALGALKHKRTQSLRGAAGAAARWGKHSKSAASEMLAPLPEHSTGNAEPMLPDGNERIERNESKRESRTRERERDSLSGDFEICEDWIREAAAARELAGLPPVNLVAEATKLRALWLEQPASHPHAAWMRWALNARGSHAESTGPPPAADLPSDRVVDTPWPQRCRAYADGRRWMPNWGPPPGEPGCFAPPELAEPAAKARQQHIAGAA